MGKGNTSAVRFRRSSTLAVAAAIVAIPLATMAITYPALWPALIVPLAVGVYGWRAGTDAGPDGLRVRAAVGSRQVPWSDVSGLVTAPDGRVQAQLRSGRVLELTGVSRANLPALVAASGHELETDEG
jgi:hypothetical protein